MRILGIHDGTHDAGAALIRDGLPVAAHSEERFDRRKGSGGWPSASIRACLDALDGPLDAIAFAGFVNPNPGLRSLRSLQQRFRLDDGAFYVEKPTPGAALGQWLQFESPFPYLQGDHFAVQALGPLLRRKLAWDAKRSGANAPVSIHEHHLCHAASTWYTSGWREGLVLVADGIGDGLALTVYEGSPKGLQRLAAMPYPHSYGLLYATLTGFMGFRPFRHEGKLTGLAALGDASMVKIPFPFTGPVENRRFTGRFGNSLQGWLAQLRAYRREDVCAWLQLGLETELSAIAQHWLRKYGHGRLALSGGIFANVRLNQRISELPEVNELHIHPHMGDGGLAAGAALATWAAATPEAQPQRWPHAFLGSRFDNAEIESALRQANCQWRCPQDLEAQLAHRIANGQIVARFEGAMEYGPRSLGNRSILASAADPRMNDRLNLALTRSDFMPFAPAILEEDADEWVEGLEKVRGPARLMTITLQARRKMAQACPAAVHVDGSLRPQLVDAQTTPSLHRLLSAHKRLTGVPSVINTSFNLHEEPIVRTPAEAIATYRAARIDALALGPYLVSA